MTEDTAPPHTHFMTQQEIEDGYKALQTTSELMRFQQQCYFSAVDNATSVSVRVVRSNGTLPSVLTDGSYA